MSEAHFRVIRPASPTLRGLTGSARILVRHAGLLREMTATRIKTRYRQSMLGWLWAVLQPLALMSLYAFIFSRVASYDTGPVPYDLFVLAGLVPWTFCATSISTAAAGMLSHHALMAKVYFPREIVPLSYVGAALVDLGIALALLALLMLFPGITPTSGILMLPAMLVLLVMFVTAFALMISSVQVRVRDVAVALPMALQVLLFATPVVYPLSAVPPDLRVFFELNPLALLTEGFRAALLGRGSLGIGMLAYCTLAAILSLAGSYFVFKAVEPTIVDEI